MEPLTENVDTRSLLWAAREIHAAGAMGRGGSTWEPTCPRERGGGALRRRGSTGLRYQGLEDTSRRAENREKGLSGVA